MPNSMEQLFQEEVFQRMDPKKIDFIKKMIAGMEGKSDEQKFQYLMRIGMEMKQSGQKFTRQELALIIDTLKSTLSPQQRRTFDMLVQMMETMNK
ncbi:MAG: hypothetical protein GX238_08755 [Epulopiscium sp.]|nr:hypothetical protein [Candidatus Epulonipiscium sp.]